MCTENYSDLVELLDCDRLQIISMTTSAGFWLRASVDQRQTSALSGLEDCRVCTQMSGCLCIEICSSEAAEEGSEIFYVLIEIEI